MRTDGVVAMQHAWAESVGDRDVTMEVGTEKLEVEREALLSVSSFYCLGSDHAESHMFICSFAHTYGCSLNSLFSQHKDYPKTPWVICTLCQETNPKIARRMVGKGANNSGGVTSGLIRHINSVHSTTVGDSSGKKQQTLNFTGGRVGALKRNL